MNFIKIDYLMFNSFGKTKIITNFEIISESKTKIKLKVKILGEEVFVSMDKRSPNFYIYEKQKHLFWEEDLLDNEDILINDILEDFESEQIVNNGDGVVNS